MKKTIFALCLAISSIGLSQEMLTNEVPRIVVTNLHDKLRTQVTIDNTTGMDIRRLNLDSIHADKHKSRHTALKNMGVAVPTPHKVGVRRIAVDDPHSIVRSIVVDNA